MATVRLVELEYVGQADADGYTERYVIIVDGLDYTAQEARFADGIPQEGTANDMGLIAHTSAQIDNENPLVWHVDVKWGQDENNVRAQVIEVSCTPQPYEHPAYVDKNGNAIVNAAGDAFETQPTFTEYDELWTIKFTDDGSKIAAIRGAAGLRNGDAFSFTFKGQSFSFNEKQARLIPGNFSFKHTYNGEGEADEYWEITVNFLYRSTGEMHDIECANLGFYDAAGNVDLDNAGNPKTTASLLNESGNFLADGSTAEPLTFQVKDDANFSSIFSGL